MSQNKPPPPPPPPFGPSRPLMSAGTKLPPKPTTADGKTEETVKSLEEMVRAMNEKIQKAEVLNGGFTEIKNKVSEVHTNQIRMEMDMKSIRAGEEKLKEKVEEINDAIYDPDNGIYRRINESLTLDKQRDTQFEKVVEKLGDVEKALQPIEKTEEDLKKIAGDDLEQLQSIVKTRRIIDRMFWIMLTALLGGVGKLLWDFISSVNH